MLPTQPPGGAPSLSVLCAIPLAFLASDPVLVVCFVAAEIVVIFATWAAEALENHSRGEVLDRLRRAGRGDGAEARLDRVGSYALSARLARYLGNAILVLGIGYVALEDTLRGAADGATGVPWGALSAALAVAFAVTFLLNDVLVRLLARRNPDRFVAAALPWLEVLRWLTAPIRLPLVGIARLAFRSRLEDSAQTAREEVLENVEEGERDGSLTADEAGMIESVIALGRATVADVLTARGDMSVISADATLSEALEFVLADGHSRIPVTGEDRDDVIGLLYAHDLLGKDRDGDAVCTVRSVMREPFFVPDNKRLNELLAEMRARKVHMAMVANDFGGTAGLVTIEDVLEEIVGEIEDEFDKEESRTHEVQEGILDVEGRTPIEEVNEALSVTLPGLEDFETVGGFMFHRLGRVPRRGDRVTENGLILVVTEADPRTAKHVRIHVVGSSAADAGEPTPSPDPDR